MGAAPQRRVLLVDDADELRALLRIGVSRADHLEVVGEAVDGVDAVEQATRLQPDLVVLDIAMPRMDGLEALPLIRAAVPHVKVVVLSGFNEDTMADRARSAGADGYLVKGGTLTELVEVLQSL